MKDGRKGGREGGKEGGKDFFFDITRPRGLANQTGCLTLWASAVWYGVQGSTSILSKECPQERINAGLDSETRASASPEAPAQAAVGLSHAPRKDRSLARWSVRTDPLPGTASICCQRIFSAFHRQVAFLKSGGPHPAMRLHSMGRGRKASALVASPHIISCC